MRDLVALLLIVVAVRLYRPSVCRNYGGWMPYEDEMGFGYMEWFCQLRRGHPGDHWAHV